jgi:hypothetical protein
LKESFIATPKDINGLSVKEWLIKSDAHIFFAFSKLNLNFDNTGR